MAEAMLQDGLSLAWTPRIALADGDVLADEASVHWAAGHRAAAPAAAVMAAGTDAALAAAMTLWTLREGCGGMLPLGTPRGGVVSLPLPRAMVLDAVLVAMVDGVILEFGLSADRLELRLSEMSLVQPSTEALLCLSALRDRGVGLAADDFGRQVGSLAMLRQVPLTMLRLDPSLTHGLDMDGEDIVVCRALTSIGHALDMRVAAQAVNRTGLLAALRMVGVDAAIGAAVPQAQGHRPPVFETGMLPGRDSAGRYALPAAVADEARMLQ